MSDDFLSGYFDSFYDAIDVAVRDYCKAKGMPEDPTEDCVSDAVEDCPHSNRREDARFSRIMNDYDEASAETPIAKGELSGDDFERGSEIGTEYGLLEGILYLVEKDGLKIMAELSSDWALHQFWWLYALGHVGLQDMYKQQIKLLQTRGDELNESPDHGKIIPLKSV
jgi:hypothetical protein